MTDDLTLTAGGAAISGWTKIRVTSRLEGCPNDFSVALTERYPGEVQVVSAKPFDPCTVKLGSDVVITGYIDRLDVSYDEHQHQLQVMGRGKCQDLVDCSAEWPTGQISGATTLEIAQKLAAPYGITASGQAGIQIPQFNLTLGETAWDVIERICRYSQLIPHEGPDGNLILSVVGDGGRMAGGVQEGVNIERAIAEYSAEERYSAYDCFLTAIDITSDPGTSPGGNRLYEFTDANVPRHRLKYLVAEAAGGGQDICKKRAVWEGARRLGRAARLTVTTDSWRDSAGALWKVNAEVKAVAPGLKWLPDDYIIGEVTFRLDEEGTHADLVLMSAAAFSPEPILLQPEFADAKPQGPPPGTP